MLKVHAKNLGNVMVLCLQGRLVSGETERLSQAVGSLPEAKTLILDLARVTAIDARGLGVMLCLRGQAEAKGIRFELMNVTKWVGQVLKITRLNSVFRITSGVEFFPAVSQNRHVPVGTLASVA
jgi:anti-anti-sigma factor